jgi:hypothetical protein
MTALLEKTRIPLQIDIGFGDRVVPTQEEIDFPTLLDFPAPHLKSYIRQSMVAEKQWSNSKCSIPGPTLSKAMEAATFEMQATPVLDKPPLALSPEFYDDCEKNAQ